MTTPTRFNQLKERFTPESKEFLIKLQVAIGKIMNYAGNQDLVFPQKLQALRHLKAAEEIITKALKVSASLTLEQEGNEKVKGLFETLENLSFQLKEVSSQKLSETEKNTLKVYIMKNVMPSVKNLLRGGVYEFEGAAPTSMLTREEVLQIVMEEIKKLENE